MKKIEREERRLAPEAHSSAFPYAMAMDEDEVFKSPSATNSSRSNASWESRGSAAITTKNQSGELASHYLPCHYFDYIAGTSTGGLDLPRFSLFEIMTCL
jgi:hypothetical protein